MKIELLLGDEVLRRLHEIAVIEGRSLSSVIEEAAHLLLRRRQAARQASESAASTSSPVSRVDLAAREDLLVSMSDRVGRP